MKLITGIFEPDKIFKNYIAFIAKITKGGGGQNKLWR